MNLRSVASLFSVLALWSASASAFDLTIPASAREISERVSPFDSYDLPVGPFEAGAIPVKTIEGQVVRRTWAIRAETLTSLQVLDPLRKQLWEAGFEPVFECHDTTCGGFDFRFGTEVVPTPDMFVNIRDYRFVSSVRGTGTAVSLLVSAGRNGVYIQMIQVAPVGTPTPIATPQAPAVNPETPATASGETLNLIDRLQRDGHVVLADLEFSSGSDQLGDVPFASLRQLSDFLQANPEFSIVLVGHTDSVGSLASNIALSKRRAASVRLRMIASYDVPKAQVQAEGNGYLAPIASNLTAEGREANRRVEVILLAR